MNPIFPSILSTNYFNLESKLNEFYSNAIDFIHLDVMDGHFVDNISFGHMAVSAIKSKFKFKIDSHLMVNNPEKMISKFIHAGSDWISFHVETKNKIRENISNIKAHNLKAGIVINPDTAIDTLFPYINDADYILLMSVFPGYGGQEFIDSTIDRILKIKDRIKYEGSSCLIQVDGGINTSNIGILKDAGVDVFVIGTFLYNSNNIKKTLMSTLSRINGV